MRILVFSDSHGYTHNIVRAISKNKKIDMIIHLGDFLRDAIKIAEMYPGIRCEYVTGNNDWDRKYPAEKVLELEGKKVLLTHGHNYGVKFGYQRIIEKGKSMGMDAVLFGHTHIPEELFSDGMLLLNPGSISVPFPPNNPTYCLLEIKEGRMGAKFGGF